MRLAAVTVVSSCLLLTACATRSALGPVDGHDLPGVDVERVKVGEPAPDFVLQDQNAEPVQLSSYRDQYVERTGNAPDWFTTNGDVFPVGESKLTPFPPTSPNGVRSFPSAERSRGAGQWNHYYVRAVNGEVRLWVNGAEVSGGTGAEPARGHLCMEAEGAPVEFRNIRIRPLP